MPTLAAALKSEIRKTTSRELKKTLKPLKRLTRQLRAIRTLSRKQRVVIARLERRVLRLNLKAGALRRRRRSADKGPQISPAAIRLVRKRMQMTRLRFAKSLGV